MKKIYTILLLSVAFIFANCNKENAKIDSETTEVIKVKVNKITENTNNQYLSVSGKVQATKSADVSTRIMGFVNKVHVSVGDKVQKGQLLISINNTDLQAKKAQVNAEIIKAKTAFANAEKNYNRYKNLLANNSITQKEMDDMTVDYNIKKANLESVNQIKNEINAQFAYSNITAPFNGIVTAKNIESGSLANPGIPLISLETPKDFEVIAMVPESEISQIKTRIKVDVLVKSVNKILKGKVIVVSTSAKNTGGQFLVKIKLDNKPKNILSGMFATVHFPIESKLKSDLVLIPIDAVVKNGQLSGIYTISQTNTALLRWLRLGKTYGNQVEVLSGLNSNETYILSAEGKLFNGAKISIQ